MNHIGLFYDRGVTSPRKDKQLSAFDGCGHGLGTVQRREPIRIPRDNEGRCRHFAEARLEVVVGDLLDHPQKHPGVHRLEVIEVRLDVPAWRSAGVDGANPTSNAKGRRHGRQRQGPTPARPAPHTVEPLDEVEAGATVRQVEKRVERPTHRPKHGNEGSHPFGMAKGNFEDDLTAHAVADENGRRRQVEPIHEFNGVGRSPLNREIGVFGVAWDLRSSVTPVVPEQHREAVRVVLHEVTVEERADANTVAGDHRGPLPHGAPVEADAVGQGHVARPPTMFRK